MSKFLHDNDDADDARAMTIPRRFLQKTAKLKIRMLSAAILLGGFKFYPAGTQS